MLNKQQIHIIVNFIAGCVGIAAIGILANIDTNITSAAISSFSHGLLFILGIFAISEVFPSKTIKVPTIVIFNLLSLIMIVGFYLAGKPPISEDDVNRLVEISETYVEKKANFLSAVSPDIASKLPSAHDEQLAMDLYISLFPIREVTSINDISQDLVDATKEVNRAINAIKYDWENVEKHFSQASNIKLKADEHNLIGLNFENVIVADWAPNGVRYFQFAMLLSVIYLTISLVYFIKKMLNNRKNGQHIFIGIDD